MTQGKNSTGRGMLPVPCTYMDFTSRSIRTYDSAQVRSRLDRVYWNQHLADQLDRRLICVALEWKPGLSAHRAVSFGRRPPPARDFNNQPINVRAVEHPDWHCRVVSRHPCRVALSGDCSPQVSALTHLRLLKTAIRQVSDEIKQEMAASSAASTAETDDPLGWTMRFIRAAESRQLGALRSAAQAYVPDVGFPGGRTPSAPRW